ncbi:DUF6297 family protein [Micromonospora olivasterospora]|uniref:DUF6297 family protein n=1 Tax=Micromonospora olivasterospora TaxID=1880 RepID=UPI0036797FF7
MTVTDGIRPARRASPTDVRRWIRQRQIAANGRVDPAAVYSLLLAAAMAVALFGQPAIAIVWPASAPAADAPELIPLAAAGLALLSYYGVLRQLGPLAASRSDAAWLLTAPVPRRALLAPAFLLTVASAALVGALTALGVAGHVAPRPLSAAVLVAALLAGAVLALGLAWSAIQAQRAGGRAFDRAVALAAGLLLAALVGSRLVDGSPDPPAFPAPDAVGLALCLAALLLVALGLHRAWAGLDRWPTHRLMEAAAVTGVYADMVYAVEPSFLTESSTRRYWRGRAGIRSSRLIRRPGIPPLLAQDLLVVRRKATRLPWLAALAALPTALGDAPAWLLLPLVLLGAMAAAGITSESTHSDAANRSMVRLMGLSRRQVALQRLAVPSVVAALWCAAATAGLQAAGVLAGQWWLLGLAIGPAASLAAMQRARASAATIGTTLVETPFGAFPSGMLLWLVNGVDVLAVLALPAVIGLTSGSVLGWHTVAAQAGASALGVVVLALATGRRPD